MSWLFWSSPSQEEPEACHFCDSCIENGFQILWQDDKYVAFKDHRPACRHHFLVVPRKHIGNVKTLGRSDSVMLKEMGELGKRLLHDRGVPPELRRMGFHIAPFNSVEHLHLHVQGIPYASLCRAAKYYIASGYGFFTKGFSWFVELEQAIDILERGKAINIIPC